MSRLQWFVSMTMFFSTTSRGYMAGQKVTFYSWLRAYFRFLKLSWRDKS